MKKIYSTIISLVAAASLTLSAQQLPNNGFEDSWAKTTCWTSAGNKEVNGTSPADWTISHVAGYKFISSWLGTTLVSDQVAGYNSDSAPRLKNVKNSVAADQIVPGYITLGTPFNTANTSGNKKDGGTFGGINFAYRPDAIAFQYQREQGAGSTEQATVVVYTWKGSVTQANVPGNISGSPTKVTMTDRDRNILGIETTYGDNPTPSADFEKIASINHAITSATDGWTYCELPLEYSSSATPAKINVIFSAGNYFSTSPEFDNKLTVDDVKLLYFSRLASLSIGGSPLEGFDSDKFEYNVDAEMPAESDIEFTCLGNSGSGKAVVSLDKENSTVTITVTNSNAGGTDADGETQHVYTLTFKADGGGSETPGIPVTTPEGTKYVGNLNIKLEAIGLDVNQEDKVYIKDNGDGTCKFMLPQFTLALGEDEEPANFGDIIVENVTMTKNADGTITYTGSVKGMELAGGEIIADVEISGTESADGHLVMNIPVVWDGLTIDVTFEGEKEVIPEPVYEGTLYEGTLRVVLAAINLDITQPDKVYIKDNGDGTCLFTLPNFSLDLDGQILELGDIVVENVAMTQQADGTITYAGSVQGMELAGGEIVADVEISGTETSDGHLEMSIPVVWEGLTIDVTFNGQSSKVAAVGGIITDFTESQPEYYNVQGVRVAADNLTPGIYIIRKGSEVMKVLVK